MIITDCFNKVAVLFKLIQHKATHLETTIRVMRP